MPGRRSGRGREEGLERTDNDLEFTSWPQIQMINQKNYYTDFLKRDDQILVLRLQNEENRNRMARVARDRDRALANAAQNGAPAPPELDQDLDETLGAEDGVTSMEGADILGSKIIVIHPGSQNLRIGLASDALPKTSPMVIARKSEQSEYEEFGIEPRAKRRRLGDVAQNDQHTAVEDAFSDQYVAMTADLKGRLKKKGVRFVPNTREQAAAWNRKSSPENIPEHNDTHRIEWTDIHETPGITPEFFTGQAAVRIPDLSRPRYKLSWPLRYGTFNEKEYSEKDQLLRDLTLIIEEAIKTQLGLTRKKDWSQYGCVFVIPDLYEKTYVTIMLELLFRQFGFARVCFIQESLSASFGAGYSTCCIVDIGAQKTSICCVDEGMCVESSRIALRYGGADVTESFVKMMLSSHFPYADLDLKRRYDFLLAEELKQRFCTLQYSDLSNGAQFFDFHLRASGQDTRHFRFKAYDEIMLAPMGYYRPTLFDNTDKLRGRRKLFSRSYDLYDGTPNDPVSSAQAQLLDTLSQPGTSSDTLTTKDAVTAGPSTPLPLALLNPARRPSPASRPSDHLNGLEDMTRYAAAASPADPSGAETPQPPRPATPSDPMDRDRDPAAPPTHPSAENLRLAETRDRTLPLLPLAAAIALSIEHGARGDERKQRDFFGGVIPTGGGAQTPGFGPFLEEELGAAAPRFRKEVIVAPPPREIDPQVLVWKGASVFGKLQGTNDSWISGMEYDRLGSRLLAYKCLWNW